MWNILKISPTDDVAVIKKAYSQQLRIHRPDEDPEGYQRLRDAYNDAIKYAKAKKSRKEETVKFNFKIVRDDNFDANPHSNCNATSHESTTKDNGYTNSKAIDDLIDEDDSEVNTSTTYRDYSSYDDNIVHDDKGNTSTTYKGYSSHKENIVDNEQPLVINKDYVDGDLEAWGVDHETDRVVDSTMKKIKELYSNYNKRFIVKYWQEILESNELSSNIKALNVLNTKILEFFAHNVVINCEVLRYIDSFFNWQEDYTRLVCMVGESKVVDVFNRMNNNSWIDLTFDEARDDMDIDEYMSSRIKFLIGVIEDDYADICDGQQGCGQLYGFQDPMFLKLQCLFTNRYGAYMAGFNVGEILSKLPGQKEIGLYFMAYFALAQSNFNIAIDLCDTLIDVDAKPEHYVLKAKAYIAKGEDKKALVTLETGSKRFKHDIELHIMLSSLYAKLKKEGSPFAIKADISRGARKATLKFATQILKGLKK